jgi:hypothetical protein
MKLHTDILTYADLRDALRETGLSARCVSFDADAWPTEHGSRKRARRFDFKLTASTGYGRRYRNSGTHGAATEWAEDRAPLYDEWGAFLGEIFHRDPNAVTDSYNGAEEFLKLAAEYRHKSAGGDVKRDTPTTLDEWRNLYRTLKPGETADHPNGYVGRAQPNGAWYYAHRGAHGVPAPISPTFKSYGEAVQWLETTA